MKRPEKKVAVVASTGVSKLMGSKNAFNNNIKTVGFNECHDADTEWLKCLMTEIQQMDLSVSRESEIFWRTVAREIGYVQ